MVNCVKETAHSLASALAAYGVTDIFSSPGSRNAPLIIAFARHPELTVRPVVDERSAAFIALGHALVELAFGSGKIRGCLPGGMDSRLCHVVEFFSAKLRNFSSIFSNFVLKWSTV